MAGDVQAARLRAVVAFVALALGMAAAREFPVVPAGVWFAVGLAGLALAAASADAPAKLGLVLAALAIGGGWFTLRILESPALSLVHTVRGGEVLTIRGVVLTSPRPTQPPSGALGHHVPREPAWAFRLAARRVMVGDRDAHASGEFTVVVAGEQAPDVRAGRLASVTGLADPVLGPRNPGEPDARLFAAQDGLVGLLRTSSAQLVTPESGSPGVRGWLVGVRTAATERAARALEAAIPNAGPARALLAGLVLGRREAGHDELFGTFASLGLAHILAISGFHLTIMAMSALLVLRLTGDRGALEPIIIGTLVVLYALAVPAEAPILRAAIMALVLLATEASGRRYDRLTILTWTACGLLLWRPMDLWSLGFQLSVGITALLLWLGERSRELFFGTSIVVPGPRREPTILGRVWRAASGLAATSVMCWLAATPAVAHATGIVSPLGAVATVLLTPVFIVVLWVAYAALAVGAVVPAASGAAAGLLAAISDLSLAVVSEMSTWPLATLRVPPIGAWAAWMATAAAISWFALPYRRRRWAALVTLAAAVACIISARARTSLPEGVDLRVDTLAVGDGACHIVRTPARALLWDCGSLSSGLGVREIPRAVRALGLWRVETIVLSHSDFDHYSGLLDVIQPLGVREVFIGPSFEARARVEPSGPVAELLCELRRRGVTVRDAAAGEAIDLAGVPLRFLAPAPGRTWDTLNDQSLVAAVGPRDRARAWLLLTGDVQRQGIAALRDDHPSLAADIVEAPHHGSAVPDAADWVAGLEPQVVLQSTGPRRIGHAVWDPVRRVARWHATADRGAAWAEVLADGSIRSGSLADP